MKSVGLTGGIGVGKSTALMEFENLGARVVDADQVVHELYARSPELREALRCRWGSSVFGPDGAVDRGHVSRIVFGAEAERRWLNDAVHPLVRSEVLRRAQEERSLLFCAIPLLFEVEWASDMCGTIAVWCDRETQWQRLRRRGWSDNEIRRRLATQMANEEKLLRADYAIINNGGLGKLAEQCRRVFERIAAMHE